MKIKDWKRFQHFKNRRPPWIKLHRDILDDHDINMISDRHFSFLIKLWLLASEDRGLDGKLPDKKSIAWRLRMKETDVNQLLSGLRKWVDITMISPRYQDVPSETETETETETEYSVELEKSSSPPSSPPYLVYPTNGKTKEWTLTEKRRDELKSIYPGIDVELELTRALDWCRREPQKRKTARGMERFLNTWLSRSQNRGGVYNQITKREVIG